MALYEPQTDMAVCIWIQQIGHKIKALKGQLNCIQITYDNFKYVEQWKGLQSFV